MKMADTACNEEALTTTWLLFSYLPTLFNENWTIQWRHNSWELLTSLSGHLSELEKGWTWMIKLDKRVKGQERKGSL